MAQRWRWGVATVGVPQSVWTARTLFLVCVGISLISLGRADAADGLAAWLNYNNYVYARWRIFDRLTFAEFVNLYTLLPLSAAHLVLLERKWVSRPAVVAVVLLLQYPLALRKVLLTSLFLIGAAVYLHRYAGSLPRRPATATRHLAVLVLGPLALYVVYLGLTLLTVIRADSQPFLSMRDQIRPTPSLDRRAGDPALPFRIDEEAIARIQRQRWRALTLYVLFSPLTRTSIPALVYPVVFPDVHPYYRLDLGQDILGFGGMPDDNLVVYQILWPDHHRGSIAAPFHLVLYSQGGALVSVAGCAVTGLLLAVGWGRFMAFATPPPHVCLYGALLVVLGIFLAIDSLRNSLLVSYGLLWGIAAVAILSLCSKGFRLVTRGRQGVAAAS
jgi:hypothetical protein